MQENTSFGFVMDPINEINTKKDSTFAMMLEAQSRNIPIFYMTQSDLFLKGDTVFAKMSRVKVIDDESDWYEEDQPEVRPLHELSCVFMRKDPPFDMEYIYTTYLLELAEREGCLVTNKPSSIRSANEKLFTTWFPGCGPENILLLNP